jgi:probable F420-dependent oxidoreductase
VEIGVRLPRAGTTTGPIEIRDFAVAAEQLGFAGLWATDHVVAPHHISSPYVLTPNAAPIPDGALIEQMGANLEILTLLAYLSALTSRIKLCTGVAVLPIRNPVLNARQLATIDLCSGGRLMCGVGVGWVKEEVEAVGQPWDRRGARTEEHIRLMRTIWTAEGGLTEFHGEFWDIPPMSPHPRPVQRPIPILVGGHSAVALERAGRLGDGWVASVISAHRLAAGIATVREVAERHGRDPRELRIYAGVGRRSDVSLVDQLHRFEELGVEHVRYDLETLDALHQLADEVLPTFA